MTTILLMTMTIILAVYNSNETNTNSSSITSTIKNNLPMLVVIRVCIFLVGSKFLTETEIEAPRIIPPSDTPNHTPESNPRIIPHEFSFFL